MAKPDKVALEELLNELIEHGALNGWQRRPLGIYLLGLADGSTMRPNTVETAMWAQGARWGMIVAATRIELEDQPTVDLDGDGERDTNETPFPYNATPEQVSARATEESTVAMRRGFGDRCANSTAFLTRKTFGASIT